MADLVELDVGGRRALDLLISSQMLEPNDRLGGGAGRGRSAGVGVTQVAWRAVKTRPV